MLIQMVFFILGILASVALVFLGLLQESYFELFESPLTGILFQFYTILIIELNPVMILLIGSLGFVVFYVVPGMLITYRYREDFDLMV